MKSIRLKENSLVQRRIFGLGASGKKGLSLNKKNG